MIQQITDDKFISDSPALTIITFDSIFRSIINQVFNIILNMFGEIKLTNLIKSDYKKLFLHALFEQTVKRYNLECEPLTIVYIDGKFLDLDTEFWEFFNKKDIESIVFKELNRLSKKLPIPMYICRDSVDLSKECGESRELILTLDKCLNKFKQRSISAESLIEFGKTNGLTSIIEKYRSDELKKSILCDKYLRGTTYE